MTIPLLRIGTRGSPLALAQAGELARRLAAAHHELSAPDAVEIVVIHTTGDKVLDRSLAAIGGKGLFTKEIEEALAANRIDLAVHSLKDMETSLPDGLVIAGCLQREDPRDVFISPRAASLLGLPEAAVLGTASLRRQAQILRARPDLRVVPMRGNVGTRLAKLAAGAVDGTLLALAGLKRLGLEQNITEILSTEMMLPAPGQGIVAVETRKRDMRSQEYLVALNDAAACACANAERAVLAALDGSCRTPIAALAEIDSQSRLTLRARLLRPDGSESFDAFRTGTASEAAVLGREAGEELRLNAGPAFFDMLLPRDSAP